MIVRRYTTAQTAPMASGLWSCYLAQSDSSIQLLMWTYISTFLDFDISFPFRPAFMKTSPSHLIMQYADAKAMPPKAKDAIRGSPSPWKVLAMMPRHAAETAKRVRASALLRAVLMTIQCHSMSLERVFIINENIEAQANMASGYIIAAITARAANEWG